jgi:diguanylate cyclase (GGDEF)-like protein
VGLVAFLGAGLTQLVVQVLLPDLVQIDTSLFLPVGATAMCVLWMLATVRRMEEHSHQQVEQLVLESSTDKLTGLWNRDHVTHKVDTFLSKRSSANEVGVGVFLMDLDNFKQINDTMGHQQGDALLKEVGQRIRLILSDTVGDRAVAARFGGDEFVVMTHATVSMAEQHALAQALIDGVSLPMQLASRTLSVKASLGYVRCQGYYDLAEDMIRDADIAMYEAKKRGRGQVVMFEPDMARAVQKRVALERELQQAIKSRELELYFQPIVDISTHRHVGLEALVRWNHPTRGFVNPNDFIPLAEEVGLIADIGRLVMEMAMQSIHAWKLDGLWMPGWYVSVNISGQEISGEGLFEEMENLMARYGLHGHDLRLELTESAVIKNLGMANIELPRFLRRGIALCMDDFGTGYSSLSYLNKLPFNVLKIDKSFIDGLEVSSDQKALVRSVLALARDMKLKVVAEGVEGPGQLALLKTMACDYGQGYYFSKPLSESLTRQWLRDAMVSAEVPEPIDSTSYKAA